MSYYLCRCQLPEGKSISKLLYGYGNRYMPQRERRSVDMELVKAGDDTTHGLLVRVGDDYCMTDPLPLTEIRRTLT
jgi:hypothetical protein